MKKLNNKGSALMLAIVLIGMVTLTTTVLSTQVNNQIKFNDKSYQDTKDKYLTEAGIEDILYDIEYEIDRAIDEFINSNIGKSSNIKNTHEDCPKVNFISRDPDIPNIQGNTGYWQLIMSDIMISINLVFQNVLYNDIKGIIGDEKAEELRDYYQKEIHIVLEYVFSNPNSYDKIIIENNINYFIQLLNGAIKIIEESSDRDKDLKISNLNTIKEKMIEVKCRLGMNVDTSDEIIQKLSIEVPQSSIVELEDDVNDIRIKDIEHPTIFDVEITVKLKNGKIDEIELKELNELIGREKISSVYKNKEIEADIEFIFKKLEKDEKNREYEILENIKSYNQK